MVKWIVACLVCLWTLPAMAWTHGSSTNLFPVVCTGVDDSVAINAALDNALAFANADNPAGVYFPTGICVYKTFHAPMKMAIALYGDGNFKSIIKVDPTNAGDVFSWYYTWGTSATLGTGNTLTASPGIQLYSETGVHVEGITIIGNRSAAGNQHAFSFYDPNEFVYFEDVNVYYMKGSCIRWGMQNISSAAFMRESVFKDIYCIATGDTSYAAIDIGDHGVTESTNNIKFYNVNVFAHYGPGVRVTADTGSVGVGSMAFYYLRIEQSAAIAQNQDSLVIGDSTNTINGATGIQRIDCYSCVFSQKSATAYAIHTLAKDASSGLKIASLHFYSTAIANTLGDAVDLTAGQGIYLGAYLISTSVGGKKDIIIGPTTGGMAAPIVLDPQQTGAAWDVTIDASMSANVFQTSYAAYP